MNLSKEQINFIDKITELKPDLSNKINKLKDTLAHQAPEIVKQKYWNEIYMILSTNIQINENDKNSNDRKIFDLYHKLIEIEKEKIKEASK